MGGPASREHGPLGWHGENASSFENNMDDGISKYRVYADEPSIIYQVRAADNAGEFAPGRFW